jgi:uncharacterized protein YuzE
MFVSYDTDARATYVELRPDVPVAATVAVSDLLAVDVDADRRPIGVEFLVLPEDITESMLERLADAFEDLASMRDRGWLRVPA